MLHARDGGETFGLAVAEFSAHHRPVLTSSAHDDHGHGRMHLDALAARGLSRFFYHDQASLVRLLTTCDRHVSADYNAYCAFEPARVMATFEQVFLGGAPPATPPPATPPPITPSPTITPSPPAAPPPAAPPHAALPLPAPLASDPSTGGSGGSGGSGGLDGVGLGGLGLGSLGLGGLDGLDGAGGPGGSEEEEEDSRWVEACRRGRIRMVRAGLVSLPQPRSIFLSCWRRPLGRPPPAPPPPLPSSVLPSSVLPSSGPSSMSSGRMRLPRMKALG